MYRLISITFYTLLEYLQRNLIEKPKINFYGSKHLLLLKKRDVVEHCSLSKFFED